MAYSLEDRIIQVGAMINDMKKSLENPKNDNGD